VVGLQGALLSHLLHAPIHLHSITVGGELFCEAALRRATHERVRAVLPEGRQHAAYLHSAAVGFEHSRSAVRLSAGTAARKLVPSSAAIIWYLDASGKSVQEVSVNGRRQGVTAKSLDSVKARCCISKAAIFEQFLTLMEAIDEDKKPVALLNSALRTYEDYKQASVDYQTAWTELRQRVFTNWLVTPRHYNQFTVD